MAKEGKTKRRVRDHASYRTTMVFSFVAIAAITVIISIGVVAFVFNRYFSAYTADNMETVANYAATRISEDYERTGLFDREDIERAIKSLKLTEDVGIWVLDEGGNIIYDSTVSGNGGTGDASGPGSAAQVAIANMYDGSDKIGAVNIWVYGSDVLMNKLDVAFRDSTYTALALAGVGALAIATFFGILFARRLEQPIRRVTETAREISEGDLSARTGMSGSSEIDRLGETLDSMAESIEKDRQLERRLTSDVAHELRTPLMAIQATVEAMLDGVYETDAEHLALVNSEVGRLSRLVDALLKLSRLENRSQPLKEEIVNLSELVEDIVASHEIFVEDSGLKIEAHVNGTVKAVCDPDMIRQAVANLVSNAVRYTPEGGRIDVSVHENDDWAIIDVADTGIGMTPDESKMVFSRFWRADSGRTRESGGLGIGLAVVKEIINRHKGKILVESEKGVGSKFTIMLPAYDEELSRKQARAAIKAFEKRQRKSS